MATSAAPNPLQQMRALLFAERSLSAELWQMSKAPLKPSVLENPSWAPLRRKATAAFPDLSVDLSSCASYNTFLSESAASLADLEPYYGMLDRARDWMATSEGVLGRIAAAVEANGLRLDCNAPLAFALARGAAAHVRVALLAERLAPQADRVQAVALYAAAHRCVRGDLGATTQATADMVHTHNPALRAVRAQLVGLAPAVSAVLAALAPSVAVCLSERELRQRGALDLLDDPTALLLPATSEVDPLSPGLPLHPELMRTDE